MVGPVGKPMQLSGQEKMKLDFRLEQCEAEENRAVCKGNVEAKSIGLGDKVDVKGDKVASRIMPFSTSDAL